MPSTPPVSSLPTHAAFMQDGLLIRPSAPSDLEDFLDLASLAGAGFTSLPANEALLAERLTASVSAFAGGRGALMLALEDRRTQQVVGCAAVKPGGEPRADFLNFQQCDQNLTLTPTAQYAELTEVGSLLLHPAYRGNGIGPWLARSRYLLIAADPDRFGTHIFSELRGVVDDDDRSPFYDAICAPHFGCSFAEADDLCAHGRQAELNARLPKAPMALHHLPSEAIEAIGRPHRAGRRALDYLSAEGFRFEGIVDLLDGGPAVIAASRAIRTIRLCFKGQIRPEEIDEDQAFDAYIAVGSGPDFRCCRSKVAVQDDGTICCPFDTVDHLETQRDAVGLIRLVDEDHQVSADMGPATTRRNGLGGFGSAFEP